MKCVIYMNIIKYCIPVENAEKSVYLLLEGTKGLDKPSRLFILK